MEINMVAPRDGAQGNEQEHVYPDASANPALARVFENFDNKSVYLGLEERAKDGRSRNFILDYSLEQAWAAFDIEATTFKLLLEARPLEYRWIHIWSPHLQQELLTQLQAKYKFSPRLEGLMRAEPRYRQNLIRHQRRLEEQRSSGHTHDQHHRLSNHFHRHAKDSPDDSIDEEKAQHAAATTAAPGSSQQDDQMLEKLNHYDIVDSIWHWSSVDFGPNYMCAGYNSLYNVKGPTARQEDEDNPRPDLPNADRVWNWLILCHDKTVISIVEGTVPPDPKPPSPNKPSITKFIDRSTFRRNFLNVFNQMSKVNHDQTRNPISLVPIRYNSAGNHTIVDAPGLLFYYLFDDWYTTYSLLAKREHQYKASLNRIRDSMIQKADLGHVNQLHRIGRQLSVLQRIYQSYDLVIERVLEKQTKRETIITDSYSYPILERAMSSTDMEASTRYEHLGIYLSSDAKYRFERLKDRIRLYAISEIKESIELKDSLLSMNFNLITIKESNSVERLTRITILLAKATILFLPVSLMTAYFSTQINARFTVKAYWISFVVILAVSFLGLLVFGKISGTTEGNMVYEPIYRIIYNIFRHTLGRIFGSRRRKQG